MSSVAPARRLWNVAETIHAVTYFAPDSHAAIGASGVKGFWMGYFAARLAPLGPIGPAAATAVCCNFSPARVRRALPDAWSYASPDALLLARSRGAVDALERCGIDATRAAAAADALGPVVAELDPCGRPLGGANLDLELPDTPIARLWQLATTLREHRGDAHVALIVGAGLDGCEVNVLVTARLGLDPSILRDTRAWTELEWSAAIERLHARGLLDETGAVTSDGRGLHTDLERRTDELAADSYLGADLEQVTELLAPLARLVLDAGVLPFPNPMGLDRGGR
jgi:hypothetical protein